MPVAVHLFFMSFMGMLVSSVFTCMVVRMNTAVARMFMTVFVFMHMLVSMNMRMFVAVNSISVNVLVFMDMLVIMTVQMFMFVAAFHNFFLFYIFYFPCSLMFKIWILKQSVKDMQLALFCHRQKYPTASLAKRMAMPIRSTPRNLIVQIYPLVPRKFLDLSTSRATVILEPTRHT